MAHAARWLRLASRAIQFVVLGGVLGFLGFLPFAGTFLVRQDPLEKSELIFVLAGARVERWLEAVDLYNEGWAPRIVLSPGIVEPAEATLRERGVLYPREGDMARDAAIALGVPADAVSVLADSVDNTAEEAAALRRLPTTATVRRFIVVTSGYHTRRAGVAFRRQFSNLPIQVIMRASRHEHTHPARWWRSRRDLRFVLFELPKLAAYEAGLGS